MPQCIVLLLVVRFEFKFPKFEFEFELNWFDSISNVQSLFFPFPHTLSLFACFQPSPSPFFSFSFLLFPPTAQDPLPAGPFSFFPSGPARSALSSPAPTDRWAPAIRAVPFLASGTDSPESERRTRRRFRAWPARQGTLGPYK